MLRFTRDALITLAVGTIVLLVVGYVSLNDLFFASAPPGPVETSLAGRARNLAHSFQRQAGPQSVRRAEGRVARGPGSLRRTL